MTEIKIYIGLNDSDTKRQKFERSTYTSLLKNVCFAYHVPFSFTLAEGGYYSAKGDYTEEQTLILTLIDVEEGVAREIAKDLCAFFHQESVLLAVSDVKAVFINETLE